LPYLFQSDLRFGLEADSLGDSGLLSANRDVLRLIKMWLQAPVEDFVILSRGKAAEALDWTRQVVGRMGVTLNEAKTCIKPARQESFDFLGYTFGPHCYKKNGHWYHAVRFDRRSGPPPDTPPFGSRS
jgi:hypothetical protein